MIPSSRFYKNTLPYLAGYNYLDKFKNPKEKMLAFAKYTKKDL